MNSFLSKRQVRSTNKKTASRFLVLVAVFLFGFTLVLSSLIPDKTSAAVPPEEYRSMEKAAIAVFCLEKFGVHGSVESKKAASGMIFASSGTFGGIEGGVFPVYTSGLVEADNEIACASNIRTAVAELGMKYDYDENDASSFLAKFYTKDGDKLKLKDGASTATAINAIKQKISEKGWNELPIPYVKAALQPKFDECIKEIGSTEYNPDDEYHFEFNGKQYGLRGGQGAGDANTNKKVGLLLDPENGEWECGEMAKKLKSGAGFAGGKSLAAIMIGDAAKEAEEEQNAAAKIEAIRSVLNEDPNITIACSASVDAAFGATSATAQINTISTWLANGGTGAMNYSAGRSMSEENAKKIAACLNQNIPELQAAIDTELDFDSIKGGSAGDGPSCESEGGVMSWIICPVIFLGDAVLRKLDQAIFSLLSTPNTYIDHPDLEVAWKNLRNIAYMILVPIMLVMVISTALGFDFISAYTVKRALPRMVIAVIFIALSYDIAKFLVVLTNNVGTGIEGIIAQSIAGREDLSLAAIFTPDGGDSATALLVGGVVSVGALAIGSIGIILSYLLVAVIGLAMGFFLLSLRQMLIVMLMILAPVAILAWIFPGNDKLWKLWWGTFSKLLLLFPLIMILITSGKVFAAILAGVGDSPGSDAIDSSFVTTLIKLVAYVGPYFMIPAMFKFAGGIFATVSGMTNDKGRGLFDRQKKYRGQKMGQTWKDTKGGNRFKGGTSENLRGRFNRGMQGAAIVGTGGAGINPRKWGREFTRSSSSAARTEQQELMQNNEAIKTAMVDDDIAKAVMHGGTEQDIRSYLQRTGRFSDPKELEDAVSVAKRAQQAGSSKAVKSAMAVGLAGSKTGFDSHSEMYGAIVAAADGDTALERALLADTRKASEGVRPDLAAPGYTNQWNALQQVKGAMGTASAGSTNASVNSTMNAEALRQTGAHAMLAGKTTQTVQKEMTQLGTDFDAAMASGNLDEATELASQIVAYRGAMGSASPEARSHVMSMLDHVGIDSSAINPATGIAYSTDEQLGQIIGTSLAGRAYHIEGNNRTRVGVPEPENLTQEIRTRAGLYDAGGGDRTPDQLRAARPPGED